MPQSPLVARKVRVVALALLVVSALPLLIPSPTAEAAGILQTYMTGLDWPVAMAFALDGRIFFAERLTGEIRIILDGTLSSSPFYHLPNTVSTAEDGLLGLALAPGFPGDPWVYAYQTYDDVDNATVYNRIVRIRDAGGTGVSLEVLLDRIPHGISHNGGPMAFGPDGKLYVLVGDGFEEIPTSSQDLLSPSGKVLRMNADGTVPTDNPFYGNASVNPYIYTYGHRSPFGLAFHPNTGKLFITDNGPECNDEINLLIPGRNYGWGPSETCGSPPPPPNNTNQDGPDPVLPLIWYTPTIAPTNAMIYGGLNFTGFQGDMIMGDFNTGSLRHLDLEAPNYDRVASQSVILQAPEGILEVEQGPDGAIWFTTSTTIYRLVDPAQRPQASFTAIPNSVDIGVPVTFDASASSDPDGTIVSYTWDFGDGSRGDGVRTIHAYSSSATYTVTLTVVDNASLSATAVDRIQVGTSTTNRGPSIVSSSPLVASVTLGSGERLTFSVDATDPDGDSLTYSWSVNGHAAGDNARSFEFTEDASGTYAVNVTLSDGSVTTSREWTVTVFAPTVLPSSLPWLYVGGILAAAIAGTALSLRLIRRKKPGGKSRN